MIKQNTEFVTFRVFHDEESLNFFTKFLSENDIDFSVEDSSQRFDPSFAFNKFNKEYGVKVVPENFAKIYSLEEKSVGNELEYVPQDYYLFDYSTEDLQKIVDARDEWNAYDYLLAKKILENRGVSEEYKNPDVQLQNRISDLKEINNIQPFWLIVFYIVAFFGGFIAIFIGYFIKTAKTTLPNGEVIPRFTKRDILHGTILFFAGIFFLIFWITRGIFFFPFLHFKY